MSERSRTIESDWSTPDAADPVSAGKGTLTSRLTPRAQQTIVFRVESAEAASVFADKFGPRDGNGVSAGADAAVDRAASSSGAPLPSDVRSKFEASTGADLSSVRVHTGAESADAAQAVGAKAYTTGQDIHFARGQYAPADPFGMHLLAHEVAHTVQQQGQAPTRQHKLEVSTPGDAAEVEADRAADAMVTGQPAGLASSIHALTRKVFRDKDVDTGTIQGAGDEAEQKALKAPLQVDTVNVKTDQSRVGELIADIDKNTPIIQQAEKANSDMEGKFAPLATNTATKAKLSVFNDKLDVSSVDTTAFAAQYRTVYADYQRLTAEANEYLAHIGVHSDDAIGAVGDGMAKAPGMKVDTKTPGLERFRAARQNLNTAGQKMSGQLAQARGAANLLQGAVYKAKAAAASANGKDAATKLAAVRAEIDEVASGVGKVVKMCSAVAGLAGSGGETGKLATPKETGGSVDIDESRSGLRKGGTVFTDPVESSKKELIAAMGKDMGSVVGDGGGGPDKWAEALVKAIGEYANKDKISKLQQDIVKAAAEESTFNAAGDAQSMTGYQDQMEAASKQLQLLLQAFDGAKKEMAAAAEALMAELNKGGKQGKDQAKGVLFLTDADRFLAQVTNAISVGENQQKNLKGAATDRKALRGTDAATEGGADQKSQYYFRCTKTTVPGRIYGTNDLYKLEKVWVTFQDGGLGQNGINQGGAGSVEGTGSADDQIAQKIDTLKKAKDQVTKLQTQVQGALGMGGPGLNA